MIWRVICLGEYNLLNLQINGTLVRGWEKAIIIIFKHNILLHIPLNTHTNNTNTFIGWLWASIFKLKWTEYWLRYILVYIFPCSKVCLGC